MQICVDKLLIIVYYHKYKIKRGEKDMKATVRKTRDKFYVSIEYIDENTGKKKYKKVDEGETREIATEKANKYNTKIESGEFTLSEKKEKTRFGECVIKGIELEEKRKSNKSTNTLNSYMKIYKTHIEGHLGEIYINKINTGIIQNFIDSLAKDYSISTVKIVKTVIKKGIHYALQNDYIDVDYTVGIKTWGKESKTDSKKNYLSVEELNSVLKETKGTELGLQIRLGATLGLRVSEVLGLSWDNIDLDNKIININQIIVVGKNKKTEIQDFTKNKNNITLEMTDGLCKELKKFKVKWNERYLLANTKDGNKLVFSDKNFKPLSPANVSKKFKDYMVKNGIKDVTFHGLRHTYATLLFESGLPIKTISELLNHTNQSVTENTYIHLVDKVKTEGKSVMESVITM